MHNHTKRGERIRHPIATTAGWILFLKEIIQKDKRLLGRNFRIRNGLAGEPTAYFHKKYTKDTVRDREMFLGGLSDIQGNYPLIIGIRENAFPEADIAGVLRKHESRSKIPIPLDLLTHVEVPFDYVDEVQNAVMDYGSHIPVIPIEWGDEYSKTLPISWIVNGE
ncbi:hypothetical protein GW940_00110 [Candidatus Microgenomates bacterium]|nr:hypothetical protein [Candidatus Microgenomates bacterium]PIP74981.1 MAG: hypothetical protein COW87_00965 [Candidatus Levybacteria bacterium CG22_combo_CG10-13_8_21_14_all_35_11]